MANILITGANRGIGLELVKLYSAGGDTVYACCRNPDDAEGLKGLGNVHVMKVAVGDDASVAKLAKELDGTSIDVIINNAGTGGPAFNEQTAFAMDFDGWADAMNVNTFGPVRVMHALLPNLRAAGSAKVVNITSQMGALSLDMPMAYAYCSSKAALNKYMKMAALELGKESIYISLVHPGWVQTDMGGAGADITPLESAEGIKNTVGMLDESTNGSFWKWNGETHEW